MNKKARERGGGKRARKREAVSSPRRLGKDAGGVIAVTNVFNTHPLSLHPLPPSHFLPTKAPYTPRAYLTGRAKDKREKEREMRMRKGNPKRRKNIQNVFFSLSLLSVQK